LPNRELIDPAGRRVNYLRLSVTDRCNLNCFYCRNDPSTCFKRQKKELAKQDFVRIIKTAADIGITKVRLTGGEPLLYPEIIALVHEIASIPKIRDISMTTNAILLPQYAYQLKKAGLKRVNISLDSLQELNFKQITNGGALKYVLEGIDAALDAGLTPLKINVVLLKGINDHEIADFARLTLDRELHVRFIEYMPIGGKSEQWDSHFLSLDKVVEVCSKISHFVPAESENGGGPARYFRLQGGKGKIGLITPLSRHFCKNCNRLRVTCDGKLKPCLFSEKEIDLVPALKATNYKELLIKKILAALKVKPDPRLVATASKDRARQFKGNRKMNEIGG
jgi:cyclic pyranopterin phosphate synthase